MNTLSLTSYAKLNLYLEILGKFPDKYHSIFTLFERVNLADQIRLKLLPDKKISIILPAGNSGLPKNNRNLVYQAANLLNRQFGIRQGVQIRIRKRIPIAAGLGGGSSNAACVLAGLNRLWKLNLGLEDLVKIGREIGSDIPFFLYNCSYAFGTSRGDEIKVLKLPVKLWHIIVVPRIKVLSYSVYKKWDMLTKANLKAVHKKAGLTSRQLMVKILTSALLKKDIILLSNLLFNSLEPVTEALHPIIKKVKFILSDLGVKAISMSGSGPGIFGIVTSRKEAYAIARQLSKLVSWDVFVARTV